MEPTSLENISIRAADNRDVARVVALVSSVLLEYGLPPEPGAKDSDLEDLEANYLDRDGIFEVLENQEGELVGTYGLFPLDRDRCELRKMYFIPGIRGKGLGRHVLRRAVAHAKRLGYRAIVLETISVLKEAIHLYTSFGFVPTETRETSARVDQAYILFLEPEGDDVAHS